MRQLFIQMSGAPGAGKTTLAQGIAPVLDAVIIDHDVSKTALLAAGIAANLAGKASYEVLLALARQLLAQGHAVILDSPCFYKELLERGQQLAEAAEVPYIYLECRLNDMAALDQRLRGRPRLPSQVSGIQRVAGEAGTTEMQFQEWLQNMKRPAANYLLLDTSQPPAQCIDEALAFIRSVLREN